MCLTTVYLKIIKTYILLYDKYHPDYYKRKLLYLYVTWHTFSSNSAFFNEKLNWSGIEFRWWMIWAVEKWTDCKSEPSWNKNLGQMWPKDQNGRVTIPQYWTIFSNEWIVSAVTSGYFLERFRSIDHLANLTKTSAAQALSSLVLIAGQWLG